MNSNPLSLYHINIHCADTEEGQTICGASTYVVYSSIIECHVGKKVLPEIGVANDPSRTPDSAVPTVIIHVCRYSI